MLQTALTLHVALLGRPNLRLADAPLVFKAPPRALSLLGYLLVHGPGPLARDRVAFALWPDDIESDARANLRRHLFYLTNDVLPAAPPVPWILADKRSIGWNPAAPMWCDAVEFLRLAADPATADDATAIYGGDLLDGFEDEWIAAPRERLRERQIALLVELLARDTAAGDVAAGIDHARRLLTVDPWREDAIRALIDLRHAAGDRSGALATYRDFEKRLHDEMGVEPMPQTTAAFTRVAQAVGSAPVVRTEMPAPQPLPAANVHWQAPDSLSNGEAVRAVPSFTGRTAELVELDAALWEQGSLAVIHGLGGVGKSALAREYARRNRERYAAVWWLNAASETGIIDGLVRLGAAFVPSIAHTDDRRSAAEHVAANVLRGLTKPALLIYDNLDDDALLRTWVPRGGAHVVVTARHALLGGDSVAIGLGAWTTQETVHYLQRELGRPDVGVDDAQRLAERLGGLPLAIAHAAAYLKATVNVSVSRYLERIDDHLGRTPRGAEYDRAVFATFREAIARAEEEAPGASAAVCFAACFAPDAIPEELLFAGASASSPPTLIAVLTDPIARDDALGALHRLSLLTFASESRTYTLHRLVQIAARRILADDDPRWVTGAVAAAGAAFPIPDVSAWPQCERLVAHVKAALETEPPAAQSAAAMRLAVRCGTYLRARAAFADAELLLTRALAIAEHAFAPDSDDVADCRSALATLLRETNRSEDAEPLLRQAIEVYERAPERCAARLATALNDLAILLHYAHRLSEAEAAYRRALDIDERRLACDDPALAVRLHNLGLLLHETGRRDEAQALLRRALQIDTAALGDDHPSVASDLAALGWLLLDWGRTSEAEPLLERALEIRALAFGRRHPLYAHCASDLGVVRHDAGRFAEAETLYHDALAIYEDRYGPQHPLVAACLNSLGELLADTGRAAEARAAYRRALASDEAGTGGTHVTTARDLNNLAREIARAGEFDEARALVERAHAIFSDGGAADDPRIALVAANAALLDALGAGTADAPAAAIGLWRIIRRSPSRGLR